MDLGWISKGALHFQQNLHYHFLFPRKLNHKLYCVAQFQVCSSERGSTERLCSPSSLIPHSERSHFRTIQRQASFDMELSKPMTTGTVLRPEPRILETQLGHSDNLPKISQSTPNTDSSTSTHQASAFTLHHMESVEGSDQQNTSELEDQQGLNNCTVNQLGSYPTECDARTANQDNTDNATWPTNSDRVVSVITDFSKNTTISVCSEHHASTVRKSYSVSMAESEMLALSVDKLSDFTETAQLTTAEKETSLERDSGIEALTEGFAEEEGHVAKEALQTNQEAKSAGVTELVESVAESEEQPNSSKTSSKAAESLKKNNGRL